jgi:hypothetical protein
LFSVREIARQGATQFQGRAGLEGRPSILLSFRWRARLGIVSLHIVSLSRASLLHQFPGLAELFVFRPLRIWSNAQRLAIFDHDRRENIPGVLGENVGDEKINVVRTVWKFEPVYGVYAIVWLLPIFRQHRLDLDTPEQFSGADDKVINFTVSPRLGNSESAIGGFAHKGKLSELAAMFVVEIYVRRFVIFFRDAQDSAP